MCLTLLQAIPEKVRLYCHPDEELIITARHKIVLTTCVTAGMFYSLSLPPDHFTQVYVDEAGQATEPECLIPIGLGSTGQVSKYLQIKKSTPCGITPKRVTSGGAHLCGFGPGRHSSEETSQRWRAVGDAVSDLTDLGIEAMISRTGSVMLNY